MLSQLNNLRLGIADFLGTTIYEGNIVYFNLWSIIHLLMGGIIFLVLLINKKFKDYDKFTKLGILFTILIFWEFIEWFFIFIGFQIGGKMFFLEESSFDILSDIILGMIGGYFIIWRKKNQ